MKQRKQKKLAAGLLCLAVLAQSAAAMPASAAEMQEETMDSFILRTDAAGSAAAILSVGMPVVEFDFGDFQAEYNTRSGSWFEKESYRQILSQTEPVQEISLDGNERFRFDFVQKQVSVLNADGEWVLTDRLDSMLEEIRAFRPMYAETYYDSASQKERSVPTPHSFPLTYVMTAESEKPECRVMLGANMLGTIRCEDYEPGSGQKAEMPQFDQETDVADNAGVSFFAGEGDVSLNGARNVADAVLTVRAAAEDADTPITDLGIELADQDGDGIINVVDVQEMLNDIVGIPSEKRRNEILQETTVAEAAYVADEIAQELFGKDLDDLQNAYGNVISRHTEKENADVLDILFMSQTPFRRFAATQVARDERGDLHVILSQLYDYRGSNYGHVSLQLPKGAVSDSTAVHLHLLPCYDSEDFERRLPNPLELTETCVELWQEPKHIDYDVYNESRLRTSPLEYHTEVFKSWEDDIDDLCKEFTQFDKDTLFKVIRVQAGGSFKDVYQYTKVSDGPRDTERLDILMLVSTGIGMPGIVDAVPNEVSLDADGNATVGVTLLTDSTVDRTAQGDVVHITVDIPYGAANRENAPKVYYTRAFDRSDEAEMKRADLPEELYLDVSGIPQALSVQEGRSFTQVISQEISRYSYNDGLDYFAQKFGYADLRAMEQALQEKGDAAPRVLSDMEYSHSDMTLKLGFMNNGLAFDDFAVTGLEYDEVHNRLYVNTASYLDLQERYRGTGTPDSNKTYYMVELRLPVMAMSTGAPEVVQKNTVYSLWKDPKAMLDFEAAQPEHLLLLEASEHYVQPEMPGDAVKLTLAEKTMDSAPEDAVRFTNGGGAFTFEQGEQEDTLTVYLEEDDYGVHTLGVTGIDRLESGGLRLRMIQLAEDMGCLGASDPVEKLVYKMPHGALSDVPSMTAVCEHTHFVQEMDRCTAKQLYLAPYAVKQEFVSFSNEQYNTYRIEDDLRDFYKAIPQEELDYDGQPISLDTDGRDNFGWMVTEGDQEDTLSLFFQLEGGYYTWELALRELYLSADGTLYANGYRVSNLHPVNEGFYRYDLTCEHGALPEIRKMAVTLDEADGSDPLVKESVFHPMCEIAVEEYVPAPLFGQPPAEDPPAEDDPADVSVIEQMHWSYGASQPFIQDEAALAYLASYFRCTEDPADIQAQLEGAGGKKAEWITFSRERKDGQDGITIMNYRSGTAQEERLSSLRLDANGILHAVYDSYPGDGIAEQKLDVCRLACPRGIQEKIRGIVRDVQPHIPAGTQFERCGIDGLDKVGVVINGAQETKEIRGCEYAEFRGDYNAPDDAFETVAGMMESSVESYREMQYSEGDEESDSFVWWFIQPGETEDRLHLTISIPDGGAYDYKLAALNAADDAIVPTLYRVEAAEPAEGGFACTVILTIPHDDMFNGRFGKGMGPVAYTAHNYYRGSIEPAEVVLTVDPANENVTKVPLKRICDETWEFYEEEYLQGFAGDRTWEKVCAFFGCKTQEEAMKHFEGGSYAPWMQWRLIEGEEEDTLAILSFALPDADYNHELIPLEYYMTADGTLQVGVWERLNMYSKQPYAHYEEICVPHGSLPEIQDLQWVDLVYSTEKTNSIAVEQP